MQIHSFIDNAFYSSESEFVKFDPYTSEKLHEVRACDLLGLVTAIRSSNTAFQQWKLSTPVERVSLIDKIKSVITERQLEFAKLEAHDQALPVDYVLKNSVHTILRQIENIKNEKPQVENCIYSPVGVVAIVASWNLSLRVILDRLIPALMAGNAVIVKVSSQSVITAHILSEILKATAAPQGLVNIIVTNDPEVKKALIIHPGIKAVSFAGRIETATEVSALIGQAAVQGFKKIQVAAGSKNSAVALESPQNQNFSEIMDSFMIGQGQLAWNSARLFVLEKYEKEWEEKIRDYLGSLKPSESIEDNSVWTPCLKKESFLKFGEIKKMAYDDQAKLLECTYSLSGSQQKHFLPPVFTKDMSRCSTLQQDQIHSPIFILSAVKYPFDIPKYSNVSYFGFAAHLWGEPDKLKKVAEGLEVGLVTFNKSSVEIDGVNCSVKQSGFGLQDYQSFGAFFSNVKKLS